MKLTPQEKNLTAHVLYKYVDLVIKKIDGQLPSPKVMRHIEQLETIKSILLKMLDEDHETVTGVITIPTEPRTLDDIYSEMCSHPDFVAGSYYDKDSVIQMIIFEIGGEYPDEPGMYDIIYKDAEKIYENNSRQIFKNIDGCYSYGMEDVDFLEDCDLKIENK